MSIFSILDYGAKPGETLNTDYIQKAIDTCSQNGGTVLIPPGTYLTGTLYLRSYVTLKLEQGAVLKGSPNIDDYATDTHYNRYDNEPFMDRCLIYAEDSERIGINGPGEINGNGEAFYDPNDPYVVHPKLIRFLRCKDISLKGLYIRMPAGWSTAFIECERVFAEGIDIQSKHSNGDGLDFDSCNDVLVTNCRFDTSDDSICLQNSVPNSVCRNIVVSNCLMKSKWAAIRIGLMSVGDIEDVAISNCVFHDISCSGFKIQATESGSLRNMRFHNIVMRNVVRPLFLTANYFHITKGALDKKSNRYAIENLSFNGISVEYDDSFPFDPAAGIILMGTPERPMKDIRLSDIRMIAPGGCEDIDAVNWQVTELTNQRPEYFAFHHVPSWGIYARHLHGLEMSQIRLDRMKNDTRKSIVLEDVEITNQH